MQTPNNSPKRAVARRTISLKEPTMIALETLRTHKLRSFLTLLGVILSVSTLIVVVSLVEGTNKYVADKVANFGANVYLVLQFPIISSQETMSKLQRTNKKITWDDYEYLRDNMALAAEVGLEVNGGGKVKYGAETIDGIEVRGVTANMGDIDVEEPVLGRYITEADNEHRANVTMIGADVAKRFFSGLDPLGRTIYIDGDGFEVVGVAKELGSAFGMSQDDFVYMPIQTYRKIHGTNASMDIAVKALSAELMQASEDEARALLRARRHVAPRDPDGFSINEPSALMDLWQSITGNLANGSIFVVLIFMVIGGIVIMNIMLASVTERTREVGVRKSVGATRRDVLLQFLIEAGVMSAMGGLVGILVAVAISFAISHFTPFPMSLPFRWVVTAILIATAIGIFFGVYPAHKASKLDPIEALRFEI